MENIIDNLSTRNMTSFTRIEAKILDIAQQHSLNVIDSAAYYTSSSRKGKPKPSTSSSSASSTTATECTWCKKRDFTFVGHVYTDCRKLKAHKEKENGSTGTKSSQITGEETRISSAESMSSDSTSSETAQNRLLQLAIMASTETAAIERVHDWERVALPRALKKLKESVLDHCSDGVDNRRSGRGTTAASPNGY